MVVLARYGSARVCGVAVEGAARVIAPCDHACVARCKSASRHGASATHQGEVRPQPGYEGSLRM